MPPEIEKVLSAYAGQIKALTAYGALTPTQSEELMRDFRHALIDALQEFNNIDSFYKRDDILGEIQNYELVR